MTKKQKVKFHRNDRRPRSQYPILSYKTKMKKKGHKIIWQVIELPTNNIVSEYFFEEDAQQLADFQNKHKVWQECGGIPKFLFSTI
jgi:hypothetical protein